VRPANHIVPFTRWAGGHWKSRPARERKATPPLAAARGPIMAMTFSAGTKDSWRFRLHAIALVGRFRSGGAIFAGLAAAGVWITTPALSFGLEPGAWLAARGFWRLYGRFYNASQFGLMNLPRAGIWLRYATLFPRAALVKLPA